MLIPLMTWPITTLSIVLVVLSFTLTAFILLHRSRGGGMTTSTSGTSSAERMLDRLTVIIGLLWLACIIGLLVLYRATA